jgi:hypothetical protein
MLSILNRYQLKLCNQVRVRIRGKRMMVIFFRVETLGPKGKGKATGKGGKEVEVKVKVPEVKVEVKRGEAMNVITVAVLVVALSVIFGSLHYVLDRYG